MRKPKLLKPVYKWLTAYVYQSHLDTIDEMISYLNEHQPQVPAWNRSSVVRLALKELAERLLG